MQETISGEHPRLTDGPIVESIFEMEPLPDVKPTLRATQLRDLLIPDKDKGRVIRKRYRAYEEGYIAEDTIYTGRYDARRPRRMQSAYPRRLQLSSREAPRESFFWHMDTRGAREVLATVRGLAKQFDTRYPCYLTSEATAAVRRSVHQVHLYGNPHWGMKSIGPKMLMGHPDLRPMFSQMVRYYFFLPTTPRASVSSVAIALNQQKLEEAKQFFQFVRPQVDPFHPGKVIGYNVG